MRTIRPSVIFFAAGLITGMGVSLAIPAVSRPSPVQFPSAQKKPESHTAWIERALRRIGTIQVGMTRDAFVKSGVFTTEGGLSTVSWNHYVYVECPYIKVDVEFEVTGKRVDPDGVERPKASGSDKIVKVSRPYLQWSIMD